MCATKCSFAGIAPSAGIKVSAYIPPGAATEIKFAIWNHIVHNPLNMTVGRPIEFDPAQALDAATRVFWQRGYEATSLDDLLAEMDLSKSSFYQTFGGKAELFQKCLESYRDSSADHFRSMLDQAASGKEFLETILGNVAKCVDDPMGRAGCLLVNTASEFGLRDPEVAALVTKA